MLRAMLALVPEPPSAGECAGLRAAVARLQAPIASGDLESLSRELAAFA